MIPRDALSSDHQYSLAARVWLCFLAERRDGWQDNGVPPHLMVEVTACVEALEEGKYKPVKPSRGETHFVVIAGGTVH